MRKVSMFIAGCFVFAMAISMFGQARDLDAIMKEINPIWTGTAAAPGMGARGGAGLLDAATPDTAQKLQKLGFSVLIERGLFAVLRSFDVNIAVSHAIRDFSHAVGGRLGPYLMIAAVLAFGTAVAGLLLFRGRSLHPAVRGAALSIVLLVLLAAAQSASLYLPVLFLQTMIGPD